MKGGGELKLSGQHLLFGLLVWLVTGYSWYAFFYMMRESFRVLTALGPAAGYQPLLVLTDSELFLYNLFYASVASALGYLFAIRLILQGINRRQSRKTRYLIHNALNDQGFVTWNFLFWFVKLGALLGVSLLTVQLQYDFSFIVDLPLFLILLPVVLFMGGWPTLRRLVRRKALKFFASSLVIFLSLSLLFSHKNFIQVDKVNHGLQRNNIDYVYNLELSISQTHESIDKISLTSAVFVVLDSLRNPKIFFDEITNPVELSDLDWQIRYEKDKLSDAERDRWMPVLFIDRKIPLAYIKNLVHLFRKSEVSMVLYSTGMKYSKYPSNYSLLRFSGIRKYLGPRYYPEFESFLDSAERLDPKRYAIRLSESVMYRVGLIEGVNRIKVSLTSTQLKINGHVVDERTLEEVAYGFYKKSAPDGIIIYEVDEQVPFGRYVEILDILYWQTEKLRNELSWELFNEPYNQWEWRMDTVCERYPRATLEWTKEEQRLIRLMEQQSMAKSKKP